MSSIFKNFAELQRNQEQCITSGRKFSAALGFDETAYYDAAEHALETIVACPAERRGEFTQYYAQHYYELAKASGDDGCKAVAMMYEWFSMILRFNPQLAY